MWGGPLRVMIVHDSEPDADLVCFADVVARDPFFVIGAKPRPDFRLADLAKVRFASVSEVPTPWICLADDLAVPASISIASTASRARRWPTTPRRSAPARSKRRSSSSPMPRSF